MRSWSLLSTSRFLSTEQPWCQSSCLQNLRHNSATGLPDKNAGCEWFDAVHAFDIAPLRNESPPQKQSGMARVLKGFHSFSCIPMHSSAIGMSNTCLWLPSYHWYSSPGDGRLSRPWYWVVLSEIWTCNLPIANPALLPHRSISAASVWVEWNRALLTMLVTTGKGDYVRAFKLQNIWLLIVTQISQNFQIKFKFIC